MLELLLLSVISSALSEGSFSIGKPTVSPGYIHPKKMDSPPCPPPWCKNSYGKSVCCPKMNISAPPPENNATSTKTFSLKSDDGDSDDWILQDPEEYSSNDIPNNESTEKLENRTLEAFDFIEHLAPYLPEVAIKSKEFWKFTSLMLPKVIPLVTRNKNITQEEFWERTGKIMASTFPAISPYISMNDDEFGTSEWEKDVIEDMEKAVDEPFVQSWYLSLEYRNGYGNGNGYDKMSINIDKGLFLGVGITF